MEIKKIIQHFLDLSIIFNYDRSGYLRHAKRFSTLNFPANKSALITGGTSGIGQACAQGLAKDQVNVFVTGRREKLGESLKQYSNIKYIQNDLCAWETLDQLVELLSPLDFIVLNAGGMPDEDIRNSAQIESQAASQLFGHYYLLEKLEKQKKINQGAKIVWVTSGGMYLKKLDIKELIENHHYDKVSTYANVKRAQVFMLDYLKEKYHDYTIVAMHPGWVDTPAVKNSIPLFYKLTHKILREPWQGADTILWILAQDGVQSGQLYFDRKIVQKNYFWFTRISNKKEILDQLVDILHKKRPL